MTPTAAAAAARYQGRSGEAADPGGALKVVWVKGAFSRGADLAAATLASAVENAKGRRAHAHAGK